MAIDSRQPTSAPSSVTAASMPPKPERTPEERKAYLKGIRDRMGHSRIEVQGSPGVSYYWARKDDGEELSRLDYLGYKTVKQDPKSPIKAAGAREDGTFVIGDVILMAIPQEDFDALQQFYMDQSEAMRRNVAETFATDAGIAGVPVFQTEGKPEPGKRALDHRLN